jgi:hypothetical protein
MTEVLLITLTLLNPGTPPDTFNVRSELQGLYDEISQVTLSFVTESDVDMLHDVLYTPDWVFVDGTGHTQTWPQVRQRAIQALSAPALDSINTIAAYSQRIRTCASPSTSTVSSPMSLNIASRSV